MGDLVGLDDIRAAADRIGPLVRRTPIFSSQRLGARTGTNLWLKAEMFQKTGSFKPRGAINRVLTLGDDARRAGLVTVSAGNHAQGLAYAAGQAGVDCVVVMPESAPAAKVAASREYGAEVRLEANVSDAFAAARALADAGRFLAHPFDDPMVIAGQGTVGLELTDELDPLDAVIVPIGGGGLISGIAAAVKAAWPDTKVFGVEPEGAATLTAALEAGAPVSIEPATLADGLTAPMAGARTLQHVQSLVDGVLIVSEVQIIEAMAALASAAKLVTEGAGAAAVAALLAGLVPLEDGAKVAAICSGGNIDLDRFASLVGS